MQEDLISLEHEIICKLSAGLTADDRSNLLWDLDNAKSRTSENGCLVMFDIANYVRPAYRGQHLYASEGKMKDLDGADISVLLYADENNRLLELEYIRWDGQPINRPLLDTLQLS